MVYSVSTFKDLGWLVKTEQKLDGVVKKHEGSVGALKNETTMILICLSEFDRNIEFPERTNFYHKN